MRAPSALGSAIEAAIDRDPRFQRHRDPVQYLCCYRAAVKHVFAFERVTQSQITLWLPEIEAVRTAADAEGLMIESTTPRPDPADPARYGRISSLKSIPELCDAVLYRIPVVSAAQALALAEALT